MVASAFARDGEYCAMRDPDSRPTSPQRAACLARSAAWGLVAEMPKLNAPIRELATLDGVEVLVVAAPKGESASAIADDVPASNAPPDALAALMRTALTAFEREILWQLVAGPATTPVLQERLEGATKRRLTGDMLKHTMARMTAVGLAYNPRKSGYRLTDAGRLVLRLLQEHSNEG